MCPRAGLDECGNIARTEIQSADRPVRSESLRRPTKAEGIYTVYRVIHDLWTLL